MSDINLSKNNKFALSKENLTVLIDRIRSEMSVFGLVVDAVIVHSDSEQGEGISHQYTRFSDTVKEGLGVLESFIISDEPPVKEPEFDISEEEKIRQICG